MSNCLVVLTVEDLPVQYTFCSATLKVLSELLAYKLVSRDVINVQLFCC